MWFTRLKFNKKVIFCSALFIVVLLVLSVKAQEKLPPLHPLKTDTPPVIDGRLDDPVWQSAPQETGFKTWHPDFGKDMSGETIIYYAYDRENLYFAFRCFDSQPDKIKAAVSKRDSIRPDDWIALNLDTFNDQQSLYALYINPLGIQMDSRFEGGQEDYDVDVIWYSEGIIDDEGYCVEVRIPFKSIRFSQKDPVEMGVVIERQISRYTEVGTFPPLDPAQGMNFLNQMRTLIFQDIKHYTLFEVLPAVTYSQGSSLDEGRLASDGREGDLSLTAKYGITSDLILDGTYNPDFSHVESDAGQVDYNLRYALFFPEKRPFFLEGREKFNFGGSYSGDPVSAIVHTRAIANPILGVKLNGKIGDKDTVASIYSRDELPGDGNEGYAHFSIFRYKRALAKDSFIGGFYTGRDRESGFNRVFGLDGQLRINKASKFGFHLFNSFTRTTDESPRESGHALGLHYFYQTRDMILMLGGQDVAENFQTETGYITRTGITRFRSGVVFLLYPRSKIIKRIDPMVHSTQIRDKFSGLYETSNLLDLRFLVGATSVLQLGLKYGTEVFLEEKFNTNRFRFAGQSQFTKRLFIFLLYHYSQKIRYIGDPYQGKGSDARLTVTYQPSENLDFDLSLLYSDFYRTVDSQKEYDYTIVRSRNTYQVNKYLFFRGILEYNSFRQRLLTDFLASFTYIPGTVIHVGYGSLYEKIEWLDGEYRSSDRFLETNRGFFFKASFLWRL